MATMEAPPRLQLRLHEGPFKNEAFVDFTREENVRRMRSALEASRGAIFSHTQSGDARFDDIADPPLDDLTAFMESQINPPELAAMMDPSAPLHDAPLNMATR